jgi:hypothetical protein
MKNKKKNLQKKYFLLKKNKSKINNDDGAYKGNYQFISKLSLTKKDKTKSDVFFVIDKLNETNYRFWKDYVDMQTYLYGGQLGDINISDGIVAFQDSIDIFEKYKSMLPYDIFVAFVCTSDIENEINNSDIEMFVTVLAKKDCPITTHMGIFRNGKYFKKEQLKNSHENLALYLHAFSAKAILEIYKENPPTYMVTIPVKIMGEILKKNFPNDLWNGSALNLKNYMLEIMQLEKFKKLLKNVETNFISFDDIYNNYEKYNKEYNVSYIFLKNEKISKEEFIMSLKKEIETQESFIMEEDKQFYFPSIEGRPETPLNDVKDTWIVTNYENLMIKFDKPEWFNRHKYLFAVPLKKSIIYLKAMAEKFIDM